MNEPLSTKTAEFEKIVGQLPVALVALSANDQTIEAINHAALELFALEPSVKGKRLPDVLPELAGQPDFSSALKNLTESNVQDTSVAVYLSNGAGKITLNFSLSAASHPDHGQSTIFLVASPSRPDSQSISDLIIDAAGLGTFNYDYEAGKLTSSVRMAEIFGFEVPVSAEDYISKIHADDAGVYRGARDELNIYGRVTFEARLATEDGSTKWLRFRVRIIHDDHNVRLRAVGSVEDVTSEKVALQRLRESEARLQNLADSMPQLVWMAEEDGRVIYYNKQVGNFAGARQNADGTWEWEGILHPEDLEPTNHAWDNAVKTKTMYEIEHRVKMQNGEHRWHLSRAFAYRNDHGLRWYGTATDVHDQKVMEMNLENIVRERTLELERSNDDLQQFAHVASHDLKEPLRKIKTFSYKLQEEFSNVLHERGNYFIGKIISSSDRMFAMINGVLNYASVASPSAAFRSVDLNAVIRNIQTDLELLIQEKQATIESVDLPDIIGAPDLIHQLFYNLLNNSLKFSQAGRPARIDISARPLAVNGTSFVEIHVTDNGIGFESEFSDLIFGTFIRLHSKDKFEGSGLGLAMCKRIVERHGGSITASSRKGIGSTFRLTLPA